MSNRSTIDHTFSIRQILEKKWEYSNKICQPFRGFETVNDSIRRETLYDILIKFDVPKKLVKLMKINAIRRVLETNLVLDMNGTHQYQLMQMM